MIELNTLKKSLELIELGLSGLPIDDPAVEYKANITELKALILRESLRNVLLSDDVGLTAQDCAWVYQAKEGDLVVLKGGKTPAIIESIHRNMGLVPDRFKIRFANRNHVDLCDDELAAYYLPATPPAQPAPVQPVQERCEYCDAAIEAAHGITEKGQP
jgi:hypothetical protein